MSTERMAEPRQRDIILGRHSTVWKALQGHPLLAQKSHIVIGHRELPSLVIEPGDRVWVLSYSREPAQNSALLAQLRAAPAREVVYVSSSSTIVCGMTNCYDYPRVKHLAELEAQALPNGRVLTLGQVYEQAIRLPGGLSMATSIDQLAAFIVRPEWPDGDGRGTNLFNVVNRPFGSAWEARAYRAYGWMQKHTGHWPCLLRPVDIVLRALGWRWYGYVFLSNRLWAATIS